MNNLKSYGYVLPSKSDSIDDNTEIKCQTIAGVLYENVINSIAEGMAWADTANSNVKSNDEIAYRVLELLGSAFLQQRAIVAAREKIEKEQLEKLQDRILSNISSKVKN